MEGQTTEHATQSPASAIANLVVRTTREHTGRGPTRAHAYITDDLVTVLLRDLLTKGEQSLVEGGRTAEVEAMRRAFQQTMSAEFVAGVEAILGRKVIAFLSANHIDPDLAVESFVLEPVGQRPGPPGREAV